MQQMPGHQGGKPVRIHKGKKQADNLMTRLILPIDLQMYLELKYKAIFYLILKKEEKFLLCWDFTLLEAHLQMIILHLMVLGLI